MLEFVTGNFFDYEADIRINTVNCVGVMGAGVALAFKTRYPKMFREYKKACMRNELTPGNPHVWEERSFFSTHTIINFPTKIDWKNPSEYEYVEKGLVWLKEFLKDRKDSVVTLPPLGCGHGKLEWEKVKNIIISYLGDLETRILVFEPLVNKKVVFDTNDVSEEELMKNNILKFYPNQDNCPEKIEAIGKLVYCKGNIELIKEKIVTISVAAKATFKETEVLLKILEELPENEFVFLLALNNSYEKDLAKKIISLGFKVVFVISEGLLEFKARKDLNEIWNWENILLVSTSDLHDNWKKYNAYNSFKVRLKLADLVLINAMNSEWLSNYEKEFIETKIKAFYVNYQSGDNKFFEKIIGEKLGLNPKTKRPNINPIITFLRENKSLDLKEVNEKVIFIDNDSEMKLKKDKSLEVNKINNKKAEKKKGRKPKKVENFSEFYERYKKKEFTKTSLAKELKISKSTLDRLIKEYIESTK